MILISDLINRTHTFKCPIFVVVYEVGVFWKPLYSCFMHHGT